MSSPSTPKEPHSGRRINDMPLDLGPSESTAGLKPSGPLPTKATAKTRKARAKHDRWESNMQSMDLGETLQCFFAFFGHLDCMRVGMALQDRHAVFFPHDGKYPLVVDDPLNIGMNVAYGSFGFWRVQQAFKQAAIMLEPRTANAATLYDLLQLHTQVRPNPAEQHFMGPLTATMYNRARQQVQNQAQAQNGAVEARTSGIFKAKKKKKKKKKAVGNTSSRTRPNKSASARANAT